MRAKRTFLAGSTMARNQGPSKAGFRSINQYGLRFVRISFNARLFAGDFARPAREVAMNAFRARQQAKGRIDLLPPEPKAPARRHGPHFPARLETVDAAFVVIRGGAPRTSNDNHRKARPAKSRPLSQHLAFRLLAAGARLCEAGLQRLPGRAFAGLTAGAFLFVFAYAGGLSALKAAATGPGETLRIAGVSASLDDRNGMKVLSVYGRVDKTGRDARSLTPL
jgi:hypothetical protein